MAISLPGTAQRSAARTTSAASNAHPAWIGFLGGALIPILAAVIAAALWTLAGAVGPQLTAAERIETEVLLKQLGFPPGHVDGVIDEQSRNAIRDFQLTAGLDIDTALDWSLLGELRAADAELNEQ